MIDTRRNSPLLRIPIVCIRAHFPLSMLQVYNRRLKYRILAHRVRQDENKSVRSLTRKSVPRLRPPDIYSRGPLTVAVRPSHKISRWRTLRLPCPRHNGFSGAKSARTVAWRSLPCVRKSVRKRYLLARNLQHDSSTRYS